jgi:hypothetical protein
MWHIFRSGEYLRKQGSVMWWANPRHPFGRRLGGAGGEGKKAPAAAGTRSPADQLVPVTILSYPSSGCTEEWNTNCDLLHLLRLRLPSDWPHRSWLLGIASVTNRWLLPRVLAPTVYKCMVSHGVTHRVRQAPGSHYSLLFTVNHQLFDLKLFLLWPAKPAIWTRVISID